LFFHTTSISLHHCTGVNSSTLHYRLPTLMTSLSYSASHYHHQHHHLGCDNPTVNGQSAGQI
jgi:hypothetical protein